MVESMMSSLVAMTVINSFVVFLLIMIVMARYRKGRLPAGVIAISVTAALAIGLGSSAFFLFLAR